MFFVLVTFAAAVAGTDFAVGLAKCIHHFFSQKTKDSAGQIFRRKRWAPTH
jgi:hypothetical protein